MISIVDMYHFDEYEEKNNFRNVGCVLSRTNEKKTTEVIDIDTNSRREKNV
jgi:hypothetical protein